MSGGVIPETPLRKLYRWLRDFPSGTNISNDRIHHAMLTVFEEDPRKLSWLMRQSVEQFQPFDNRDEHFRPKNRGDKFSKSTSDGTVCFQQAASRSERIECLTSQSSCVEYQYVDREIGSNRVTRKAGTWKHAEKRPKNFTGRGGIDVLARATLPNGRILPAVWELKIGDDSTPFLALIQALTYAAELATPNQYKRLQKHYPEFEELDDIPQIQVCLFSSGTPKRQKQLLEDTSHLVTKLFESKSSIAEFVPQIVIAKCSITQDGRFRLSDAEMFGKS